MTNIIFKDSNISLKIEPMAKLPDYKIPNMKFRQVHILSW